MKYSIQILKIKNLFKRRKYPSPNAMSSNIFEPSATTIGGFGVSLNYLILNLRKRYSRKRSGYGTDNVIYS